MLNGAYALEGARAVTGDRLRAAEGTRLVQKAERLVNGMRPPADREMSNYAPALWLIQHPEALANHAPEVLATVANFEKILEAINRIL
jgi:hypothetical protein